MPRARTGYRTESFRGKNVVTCVRTQNGRKTVELRPAPERGTAQVFVDERASRRQLDETHLSDFENQADANIEDSTGQEQEGEPQGETGIRPQLQRTTTE